MKKIRNSIDRFKLVMLLLQMIIILKFWDLLSELKVQMAWYRLSRDIDEFLAFKKMSVSEFLERYGEIMMNFYGLSLGCAEFGVRAFMKKLYERARKEDNLKNTYVVYGQA